MLMIKHLIVSIGILSLAGGAHAQVIVQDPTLSGQVAALQGQTGVAAARAQADAATLQGAASEINASLSRMSTIAQAQEGDRQAKIATFAKKAATAAAIFSALGVGGIAP